MNAWQKAVLVVLVVVMVAALALIQPHGSHHAAPPPEVTLVPLDESDQPVGTTVFAPPAETPLNVTRVPLEQWEASQRHRLPGKFLGNFPSIDAAKAVVVSARDKAGGKGTFSATAGTAMVMAKNDEPIAVFH